MVSVSCTQLDGCFKRHGIELVMNDSGQTLPFWYSAPTGHKWTQVAMQAAARVSTSDATRLMAFLFDHFHKSYENFFDWTPSGTVYKPMHMSWACDGGLWAAFQHFSPATTAATQQLPPRHYSTHSTSMPPHPFNDYRNIHRQSHFTRPQPVPSQDIHALIPATPHEPF